MWSGEQGNKGGLHLPPCVGVGLAFLKRVLSIFKMSSVKRQLALNLRIQFLFLGEGKSLFCGWMRHCFEVGLARTVLAVLDLTSTIVETQVGGQEEEL